LSRLLDLARARRAFIVLLQTADRGAGRDQNRSGAPQARGQVLVASGAAGAVRRGAGRDQKGRSPSTYEASFDTE